MIWIDIDNPPQVQYLLPFKQAFEDRGHKVVITARDYGITFDILERRGADFFPCGRAFGKSKTRKLWGTVSRGLALRGRLAPQKPTLAISASRSAALAARLLRVPAFIFCDYEFAELASFRLFGSRIVFPEVIGAETFQNLGFNPDRLIPYAGIKEDFSFSAVDLERVQPYRCAEDQSKVLVLFRPPAVETHYYNAASANLAAAVLSHLAGQENVVAVFSPRYRWQWDMVGAYEWANSPIVLEEGIEFVSLLKAVDAVITSGGTMAREAAYLGIPAFSILTGKKCAVDQHLESLGRLTFIENTSQLSRLTFKKKVPVKKPENGTRVLDEVVTEILKRSKNVD